MSTENFFEAVGEKRSPGLAGQIETLLEERPWLTSTEIAKVLGKKPDRIASIAPALVREGRLLREDSLSARGGSLFARNAPHVAEKNAIVLAERVAVNDARMAERMATKLMRAFHKAGAPKTTADA